MDAKLTGGFIAALRKEKGLTQEELAQKLNVTNKAVSRWETGSGFPDVDSMLALSEFFGVSVNELLNGGRNGAAEGGSAEELKKAEAKIACDSLDLSIKKRRSARAAGILAAVLAAVVALFAITLTIGRREKQPERPSVESVEYERWFSPLSQYGVSAPHSTAKLIDLKTGRAWVACSDPECTHSESDAGCFFNRSVEDAEVYAAEYLDNHIFFVSKKKTGSGSKMALYDYSMETGGIEEVYTYALLDRDAKLFTNRSKLFFTTLDHIEGNNKIVSLNAYDPADGSVSLIEKNAAFALAPDRPVFLDDHYICVDHYDGESGRIVCRRRSYDGKTEEYFDALPDGTPLERFGFEFTNGLFANVFTGSIYLPDEDRFIDIPTGREPDDPQLTGLITPPVAYGDSYYYQTKSGGSPAYDNEVYIVGKDGSFRHYSIDCQYRFVIAAAYENVIFGRAAGRVHDNGNYTDYSRYARFIRIDLDTGETALYDAALRNDPVYMTFTSAVTLNEE